MNVFLIYFIFLDSPTQKVEVKVGAGVSPRENARRQVYPPSLVPLLGRHGTTTVSFWPPSGATAASDGPRSSGSL